MQEAFRRIEISRIIPTNVSNNNLYAVVYMDRDSNSRVRIDFSNENGANPRMEFEAKESNIQNSRVHLVIKLRRQGNFVDKHIGEVCVAIRELFDQRSSPFWGKSTVSKPIQMNKCFGFGRPQQQGAVGITYDFGMHTFLKQAEAPNRGHIEQIVRGVGGLLSVISSLATVISCLASN